MFSSNKIYDFLEFCIEQLLQAHDSNHSLSFIFAFNEEYSRRVCQNYILKGTYNSDNTTITDIMIGVR